MHRALVTPARSAPRLAADDLVVCLHSSTGSRAQWRPLVRALTEAAQGGLPAPQVLAPDLFGHGQSPDWPALAPNTLDVDAQAVRSQISALDDEDGASPRGVHLIGHSYGAAVALRLALLMARRQAHRVLSLTLYEPVVFGLLPAVGEAARHEIADIATAVATLVKAGELTDAARVFVGYWGGPQAWGAMSEAQQATVVQRIATVPRHFEALFAARWQARELQQLQMPVLLMQGGSTREPARRVVHQLHRLLPRARGCTIAGAAHLGPITHAEPVVQAMLRHLDPAIGQANAAVGGADTARLPVAA